MPKNRTKTKEKREAGDARNRDWRAKTYAAQKAALTKQGDWYSHRNPRQLTQQAQHIEAMIEKHGEDARPCDKENFTQTKKDKVKQAHVTLLDAALDSVAENEVI